VIDRDQLGAKIEPLFRENFEQLGDLGAAVSIWHEGEEVLHLYGGYRDANRKQPWTEDTIVLFWSATKGLGSACLLHALQRKEISLVRPVAEFWTEFAQAGKEAITIGQLLSHQAGLCAIDEKVSIHDYPAVIGALERQAPLWPPGTSHGYHARTFGFLVDELLRRIDGRPVEKYWRDEFAIPLQLDIWIALPLSENNRVATTYAPKAAQGPPEPAEFYRQLAQPGSIAQRTFSCPEGLPSVAAMNKPEIRAEANVSLSGIGSARDLAKFYAMLADGGRLSGKQFFEPETLSWMRETRTDGIDRVFGIPSAFSAGFMKDSKAAATRLFGPSGSAFGHPGAGGSHAFADPENKISFAYVMNQMAATLFPNERALRLVKAIYGRPTA
jgi:CubicO group peptidase (beta-lactamase class C family)